MLVTVAVRMLVTDVNELLRTIWQYLFVYDNTLVHAELEASLSRLIVANFF